MNRFWSDDTLSRGDLPLACLFDIDGTLVDSNYLHIEAWDHAFSDLGKAIPAWRIHRLLGKDSSDLLGELLGEDNRRLGSPAKQLHSRYYRALASRLKVIDGARELIEELAGRGVRVVLATSAPEEELTVLRSLLSVEDDLHAVTSADDVDRAKPDPGLLKIALARADVAPQDSLMIGDAVWDMDAAGRAGIPAIGVLSGGIGADELRDAGAAGVFGNARDILDNLDQLPRTDGTNP